MRSYPMNRTETHPMRTLILTLLTSLLLALPAAARPLQVVATTPDLAALAAEVGGDDAAVTSLSLHTQDPHWVDARPNLALKMSRADLLVLMGLELEVGWLPVLQKGSRNGKIQTGGSGYLDCSTFVSLLEVPTQRVERSQGDIHPGGNPHYMTDPRRAILVARGIAERMATLMPDRADAFRARADAFAAEAQRRIADWQQRTEGLKGLPVVTYHRSWPYLEEWLGFQIVGEIEPKPGVAPSPSHVARVMSLVTSQHVPLILQEIYHSPRASQLIADKSGATLLRVSGGTNFVKHQRYLDYIEELVAALEPFAAGGAQ